MGSACDGDVTVIVREPRRIGAALRPAFTGSLFHAFVLRNPRVPEGRKFSGGVRNPLYRSHRYANGERAKSRRDI